MDKNHPDFIYESEDRPVSDPGDPAHWQAVEAQLCHPLAEAALAVGQLDADLARQSPSDRAGALQRLALIELSEILRASGHRIAPETLAADQLDAATGEEAEALLQARWALRRLNGQGGESLRGFLGLHRREGEGGGQGPRLTGAEFDGAAEEYLARLGQCGLHPLAEGPLAKLLWRRAGLSPEGEAVEAAIWAGVRAARHCEALHFLPLGPAQHRLLIETGSAELRLGCHLAAVRAGAMAARQHLRAVADWHARSLAATTAIKGRNPARVLAVLAAFPLLHTSDVAERAGISRITAERLLARLTEMGLLREATGARRYRLWAARLR